MQIGLTDEGYKSDSFRVWVSQASLLGGIQSVYAVFLDRREGYIVSHSAFLFHSDASDSPRISSFLEGLCDHLYDHLRPRILHEMDLITLCDVCTVLQGLMIADVDDLDEVESPYPQSMRSGSYFPAQPSPSINGLSLQRYPSFEPESAIQPHRPAERFHAGKLLEMILKDVQTRMVFRSQAILRSDVASYTPRGEDLDYPNKISQCEWEKQKLLQFYIDVSAGIANKPGSKTRHTFAVSLDDDDDDNPAYLQMPEEDVQETWYPSLRTTLWLLSCVHTFVEVSNVVVR